MEKNNDSNKFQIKDLFTNKQYRSIIILIFYAVLFAVVIIGLRSGNDAIGNDSGTTISNLDGYELIDNKNFSYKYTVELDDAVYLYEGKKYKDKELVTVTKGEEYSNYYIVGDKTYIKGDNGYTLSLTKPIIIFDFLNTDILDEAITRGLLVNEVTNEYRIDNQSLYDVFNSDNTKVEDGYNYVTLSYRNSYVTKITFDLYNYSKIIGENYDKVIITLEYSDFNLIDDFEEIVVD